MKLNKRINKTAMGFVQSLMDNGHEHLMPKFKHNDLAKLLIYSLRSVLQEEYTGERLRFDKDAEDLASLLDTQTEEPLVVVAQGALYIYLEGVWTGLNQLEGLAGALANVPVWRKPTKQYKDGSVVTWQQWAEMEPASFNWGDLTGTGKAVLALEEINQPDFFDTGSQGGVCLNDSFLKLEEEDGVWQAFEEEHSPKHRAMFKLPLDMPDFNRKPQAFIGHLERCYKGDKDVYDKIAVIQEWFGMLYTGFATKISDARVLMLQGAASSGKSIIHAVAEASIPVRDGAGNRLVEAQNPDEWNETGNAGDFKRCLFKHVVLNSTAELPSWKHLKRSDIFKKMVTGDPISARDPGGKGFSFTPMAAQLFSSNHDGQETPDGSDGFFRRWLIVGHNRTFAGARDARDKTGYLKELTAPDELQALLGWAILGALRVLRNGEKYTFLESSKELVDMWKGASDPFSRYWEDCVLIGGDFIQTFVHTFREYQDFCRLQLEKPLKRGEYEAKLKSKGVRVFHDTTRNQKMVTGMQPRDGTGKGAHYGNWRDDFRPKKHGGLEVVK